LKGKSAPIRHYLQLREEIQGQPGDAARIMEGVWPSLESSKLKQRLILDHGDKFPETLMASILEAPELKLRQAAILAMDSITPGLRSRAEALLADGSYTTMETALYKLWRDFPGHRAGYLDSTKGTIGFPNKNLRLLWLLLAVATE